MALIKSNFLSAISGSMNGTTFSRNSSGAYMRNRTVPVNPNTELQVQTRAGFTNASISWRDLGDAEQAAWKTYAQNSPVTNRIGDVIHLSGFGQYMALNGFRAFLGLSPVTNAPIIFGSAAAVTALTLTIDETANEIDITVMAGGSATINDIYGVWISNPVGTGQNFYKGPWNYVGQRTGVTLTTTPTTPPFQVTAGQQYFVKLRYQDADNRLSPTFQTGKITAVAV